MTDRPSPEQLDHLLGHADSRQLTPAEAALLRAGVQQVRQQASFTDQVSVDAEPYIARLRAQLTEAWGQGQAELALSREENQVLRERLAAQNERIAALESAAVSPPAVSTRP